MNSPPATTTLDFIRHGLPEGGSRYRGQIDDPLSPTGWAQMRAAVGDHCPWHAILTSPLQRCRCFAEELAARHALPLHVDERLQELGFGSWEGKTKAEITATDPLRLLRFYTDPLAHPPAGGEPLAIFRQRITAALEQALADHRGQHLLIVGHACQIRMSLAWLLDFPDQALFRIEVGNAAITRMQIDERHGLRLNKLLFHAGQLEPSHNNNIGVPS